MNQCSNCDNCIINKFFCFPQACHGTLFCPSEHRKHSGNDEGTIGLPGELWSRVQSRHLFKHCPVSRKVRFWTWSSYLLKTSQCAFSGDLLWSVVVSHCPLGENIWASFNFCYQDSCLCYQSCQELNAKK